MEQGLTTREGTMTRKDGQATRTTGMMEAGAMAKGETSRRVEAMLEVEEEGTKERWDSMGTALEVEEATTEEGRKRIGKHEREEILLDNGECALLFSLNFCYYF